MRGSRMRGGEYLGRLPTYLTLDCTARTISPGFDVFLCPLRRNGDYRAKARAGGREGEFFIFIEKNSLRQTTVKEEMVHKRVDVARMISSATLKGHHFPLAQLRLLRNLRLYTANVFQALYNATPLFA